MLRVFLTLTYNSHSSLLMLVLVLHSAVEKWTKVRATWQHDDFFLIPQITSLICGVVWAIAVVVKFQVSEYEKRMMVGGDNAFKLNQFSKKSWEPKNVNEHWPKLGPLFIYKQRWSQGVIKTSPPFSYAFLTWKSFLVFYLFQTIFSIPHDLNKVRLVTSLKTLIFNRERLSFMGLYKDHVLGAKYEVPLSSSVNCFVCATAGEPSWKTHCYRMIPGPFAVPVY